ncbi:MAG: hypothetical protein ABEJ23_03595 [Haloarculaceae archaeon]
MPSRRVALALLVGVLLLAQPVVGNGPGQDVRYTYAVTQVSVGSGEAVETMYHLPAVAYGTGSQLAAVRAAANDTYTRPVEAVDPAVRALTDRRFVADDAGDQYYQVEARVVNGTFELRARRAPPRDVAAALAVSPREAPPAVQDALNGDVQSPRKDPVTLVRSGDRFLLVRPVATEHVPDPLTLPKLFGYAVGIALLTWAALSWSRGPRKE